MFPKREQHSSKLIRIAVSPNLSDVEFIEKAFCQHDDDVLGIKGNGKDGGSPAKQRSSLYGVSLLVFQPSELSLVYSKTHGIENYNDAMANGGRSKTIVPSGGMSGFEIPPKHKDGWFKLGGQAVWGDASKDEKEGAGITKWAEELTFRREKALHSVSKVELATIYTGGIKNITFCFTGKNPNKDDKADITKAGGSISTSFNNKVDVMVVKNANKLDNNAAVSAIKNGVPFLTFNHFMSLVKGNIENFEREHEEGFYHDYDDEKDGDLE